MYAGMYVGGRAQHTHRSSYRFVYACGGFVHLDIHIYVHCTGRRPALDGLEGGCRADAEIEMDGGYRGRGWGICVPAGGGGMVYPGPERVGGRWVVGVGIYIPPSRTC